MTTRALIPLVAPCITQHDRDYMAERVAGGLLEDETEVTLFEEAFAEYVGCAGAVAVCSGTTALRFAVFVSELAGNAVQSFTCVAVRNALTNGPISYRDSTFSVANQILEVDGPVSVVAHCFGTRSVSNWAVVEDWTLSLGGVPELTSPLGVCSTHWSKMISTGRGGIVFGDDIDLLDEVRTLTHYESHTDWASSDYMSSMQAALGVSQLEQLESFIKTRRGIAGYYTARFADAGFEIPEHDCDSVFFRYIIAVDNPFAAVAELANRGIECGHGVNPLLHRLAGLSDDDFPGACRDATRLLSVPVHPSLTDAEVEYVADQVVAVCGR